MKSLLNICLVLKTSGLTVAFLTASGFTNVFSLLSEPYINRGGVGIVSNLAEEASARINEF